MKESKDRKHLQCILCPKCPYWNDCWEMADCAALDYLVRMIDGIENLDSGNPDQ